MPLPLLRFTLLPLIAATAQLHVLPLPNSLTSTPGCLIIPDSFALLPSGPAASDPLLLAALQRAKRTLSSLPSRGEAVQPVCVPTGTLPAVTVLVDAPRAPPHPALGDDEAYILHLAAAPLPSVLRAATVWGALRGLETLTQLVAGDAASDAVPPPRRVLPAGSVNISDAPRFSHRGLMVDTGRSFLPVPTLLATLDAMAAVKLNVLHWHLVDDEAFPVESDVWPNLTAGAMQAPSRTHVYSRADVAAVVDAATARGIRVMPEFDVPGHTTSWFAGYPALRTQCQAAGEFSAPMNPTLNSTYDFLAALFEEQQARFPDAFFGVGGDEVEFTCWLNNSGVVAFMSAHGMTEPSQLQLYFEARVAALFGEGKRVVIWEENAGRENLYPPNAVVEVWKEPHGNLSVMEALVREGYTVIYTTPDWYLDYPHLASGFDYKSERCLLFAAPALRATAPRSPTPRLPPIPQSMATRSGSLCTLWTRSPTLRSRRSSKKACWARRFACGAPLKTPPIFSRPCFRGQRRWRSGCGARRGGAWMSRWRSRRGCRRRGAGLWRGALGRRQWCKGGAAQMRAGWRTCRRTRRGSQ